MIRKHKQKKWKLENGEMEEELKEMERDKKIK